MQNVQDKLNELHIMKLTKWESRIEEVLNDDNMEILYDWIKKASYMYIEAKRIILDECMQERS